MRQLPTRDWSFDAGLGVLAASALLVEERARTVSNAGQWQHVALAVVVGGAVALRRRAPLPVLGVVLALLLAALPVLRSPVSTLAIVMLVAGTVAYHGRRRRSVLVALALVPALVAFVAVGGGWSEGNLHQFADLVPLLAAVAVADAVRARGDARAARRQHEQAAQAAAVRQMFDEHRLDLARELHDSIAHALVGINVSAGVATHVHARDGDPALLGVLNDVKNASAAALQELRATLGRLRPTGDHAPLHPSTTNLAGVGELVAPLQAAGLRVHLVGPPPGCALPAATAHAAYRITQEALTNVLRHADAHTVEVDLAVQDRELRVQVTDDGRTIRSGEPAAPGGHGLRGMQERAASVGGSVQAGPRPAGGWLVSARLPLDAAP